MTDEKKTQREELSHAAWPGFRTAFYMVFSISFIYLLIIFIMTLGSSGGTHH